MTESKRMTDAEYVECSGSKCPYCGSSHIFTEGQVEVSGTVAYQNVKCGSDEVGYYGCGAEWTDEFSLVGYTAQ